MSKTGDCLVWFARAMKKAMPIPLPIHTRSHKIYYGK
jgi:hypothetical protein